MNSDLLIILAGSLVALNGAWIGCYLLLQKNALLGDAISHAVLPGIVIAFLISGSKASIYLLLGAAISGIILSQLIYWLQEKVKMQKDAALGLSYTAFFAFGLLLLSVYLNDVDLDAECALFGEIAFVPIDVSESIFGSIPRAFLLQVPTFILTTLLVGFGKKGLFLSTFNPEFSMSIGVPVKRWQGILLALTSLYTVMSFELVGAIMVVGFMIIPASTAYLFVKNLKSMILWSSVFGVSAVILGYLVAIRLNVSIAGSMVTFSGLILFATVIITRLKQRQRNGRKEVTSFG
ncbi:metal ABC transporter permease [Luteibaculum oceani]|uniref:Metal ABC transporter permease n=1 Tax=Luteibaculum oceani TaxID=1294296 RepID=A0A5C6VC52_9FLAO|nr:metal ABC transporter permease [Luteibaculum oceani]TXC82166.1 metal ABC transporter permease [Luteibaculum oceani]